MAVPKLHSTSPASSRFTPAAAQVINLILTDVGRPVGHIVSNLRQYDHLVQDLREVLVLVKNQ